MTSSPKKHIIDSLLREIYGDKSPPDQTDAILRRLESGDSTLLTESNSEKYSAETFESDSGPFPTIQPEKTPVDPSRTANWVVIAATVVFCVGLVGAMARVLIQSERNDQVADSQSKENGENDSNPDTLKHSKSLAVKDSTNQPVDKSGASTNLANHQSTTKANQSTEPSKVDSQNGNEVKPFSNNPLPTFAQNVQRKNILDVKSHIDSSLEESWHVHVIANPQNTTQAEWIRRVFAKLLGRDPESGELKKLQNYLTGNEIPTTENQLRVIESIMTDEATSREFAHFWADRFLTHLTKQLPDSNDDRSPSKPEIAGLRTFLRQAFVKKISIDEVVRQLIVAEGSVDPQAIEFNGAAGFVALSGNDPNQMAENISRSFLGTEITCAKCHSDSVHEQSRKDYLGLTAFLQGTNVTRKTTGVPVVSEFGTKRKVPGLFYNSRNGLAVYAPPMIAGHDAELDQSNGRQSLASQLVRSDRFAKSMVNWVWSEIYGYGLAREGRINQSVNSPHQFLMAELSEQLVATNFDFQTVIKWALLAKPFAADGKPSADTLVKDIPKYGGVPFFSYQYDKLEHDAATSVGRLAKAYQTPEGLTSSARLSLNIKPVGKGLEIIGQMEKGVLPNGLKFEDEIPDFARGWGVESIRVTALDRIADSNELTLVEKIEHLYLLALHRSPSRSEIKLARSLFKETQPKQELPLSQQRTDREILQDLWWAILPR